MRAACSILTNAPDKAAITDFARTILPDGDFRRIVIKPNWVMHETNPAFPIAALVTSSELIHATIAACLDRYPNAESITVADVPLQTCDWNLLARQSGLNDVIHAFAARTKPVVRFLDLRRERYVLRDGFLEKGPTAEGDPLGYREVILDDSSALEPVSDEADKFRVSDYDPGITASSHRRGCHRYLIAGSVLNADLLINLPKLKTHQKAGITGALKNLVGTVGSKACLAHHRTGGDEFAPDADAMIRLQVRARDALQKRSRRLFGWGRHAWQAIKRFRGIATEGTRENLDGRMYIGSGSWYGNDTIWRMVYDLNRILRYAPRQGGTLAATPQRAYVAIMDAMIAGEGNGPLQPLPVSMGALIAAEDPFLVDTIGCRLMGFDEQRIPLLSHRLEFRDPTWGRFDVSTVPIEWNGEVRSGIPSLTPVHKFVPSPGWKGHIESA